MVGADKELTLADFIVMQDRYGQKLLALQHALPSSVRANGILLAREMKRLQETLGTDPRKTLPGRILRWPFRIEWISEETVKLKEYGQANFAANLYLLGHDEVGGVSLYWKVGRDLSLREAEKLRNDQVKLVRVKIKGWVKRASRERGCWDWEFVDYPTGKVP
jgi:hypothetical protein